MPERASRSLMLALLLAPLLGAGASRADDLNVPPPGFTALFNGQDLEGWWGMMTQAPNTWEKLGGKKAEMEYQRSMKEILPHWFIERGELTNNGEGFYLTTKEYYRDFELRLEVMLDEGTDSGIYLRGMPQVEIWDSSETRRRDDAAIGSGGLRNNLRGSPGREPLVKADRPIGEWNQVRVIMVGERVTVELNGQLVVDHARLQNYFDRSKPLPLRGPIQLQSEGGRTRWRNIFLREILPGEAISRLAAHDRDRYEPIFNGQDFDGWTGATDDYEVRNGALMCREGRGGTLFTEAEYGDFAVRMQFMLPPGGNNGLAIRYPGEGDTAYTGMCELQVLDNSADKYAKLDPRQYHGSVYGQVPAARGYLYEPNNWNFQEVTVVGSRITVELNGTRILDADLAKVTDLMYPEERFAGRTRERGHFGFAGHSDPVRFRNVRVHRITADSP